MIIRIKEQFNIFFWNILFTFFWPELDNRICSHICLLNVSWNQQSPKTKRNKSSLIKRTIINTYHTIINEDVIALLTNIIIKMHFIICLWPISLTFIQDCLCPGCTPQTVCVPSSRLCCRPLDFSYAAVFNQRTQSEQHMADPDLVLSDTLILKQTRCDRSVWVKGASQKPSGWAILYPLMFNCVAAVKEQNHVKDSYVIPKFKALVFCSYRIN